MERHDVSLCSKCKTEKSIAEFYKNLRRKNGLSSCCKECQLEYNKLYRAKKKLEKKKNVEDQITLNPLQESLPLL